MRDFAVDKVRAGAALMTQLAPTTERIASKTGALG